MKFKPFLHESNYINQRIKFEYNKPMQTSYTNNRMQGFPAENCNSQRLFSFPICSSTAPRKATYKDAAFDAKENIISTQQEATFIC